MQAGLPQPKVVMGRRPPLKLVLVVVKPIARKKDKWIMTLDRVKRGPTL